MSTTLTSLAALLSSSACLATSRCGYGPCWVVWLAWSP
jgi:hypothetical protein